MSAHFAPMMIDLAHEASFRLGTIEVRPSTREVIGAGRREVLEPRIMQVLVALARRRGEVVSRDDLIASCWGGRAVGDDAINRCIAGVRRLAETHGGFSVETVARVGYRLEATTERPRRKLPAWTWLVAAAAVLAFAAGGAAWLLRGRGAPPTSVSETRVAVLPFDTLSAGQDMRYFADGLADEIVSDLSGNQVQAVSRTESAALRGPGAGPAIDRLGARLLLDGTVRRDADTLQVRVHLDDARGRVTLWSKEFEGPAGDAAVLQDRIAYRIVAVLACSRRALQPGRGLSDPNLLTRYLHVCDLFADWNVGVGYDRKGLFEWIEGLRTLTVQAPDFASAHAELAVGDAVMARSAPPEQAAALRREGEAEASHAIALDPNAASGYGARQMLLPQSRWAERERLLRKGVAVDPQWPSANGWLGMFLAETGRLREATDFTQKAAAADLVLNWSPLNAWITCGAGQPDQALSDIARFRRVMPQSAAAWDINGGCLEYSHRWDDARVVIDSHAGQPGDNPQQRQAADAFLAAAKSGAPGDRATARRLALALAGAGGENRTKAIEWLAYLGYVDDAFATAAKHDPDATNSTFLFLPLTAPMRRDPRFMQLAARLGLVDYWQAIGRWPDFCAEPGLPYDCRAQAAQLGAVARP